MQFACACKDIERFLIVYSKKNFALTKKMKSYCAFLDPEGSTIAMKTVVDFSISLFLTLGLVVRNKLSRIIRKTNRKFVRTFFSEKRLRMQKTSETRITTI